jgi:hypothetical protein
MGSFSRGECARHQHTPNQQRLSIEMHLETLSIYLSTAYNVGRCAEALFLVEKVENWGRLVRRLAL